MATSSRSEQARAIEKRAAILHAATELLLNEGLRGVTHRQVAAEAKVPVGSIGYYYSTREKRVVTCLDQFFVSRRKVFHEIMGGSVDLKDPVQFAEAVVNVISCAQAERVRQTVYAFVDSEREPGEVQAFSSAGLEELKGMVTKMMEQHGVDGLNSTRVVQVAVGAAVTENHRDAPVSAVIDLLRVAEQ